MIERIPFRQVLIYGVVGSAAALTHLAVTGLLVETLLLPILIANAVAFCFAFMVSFWGHSRLTFEIDPAHASTARLRFLFVALLGFLLNQLAYARAIELFGPRYYLPILAVIIVMVAGVTFLLSKLWAFAAEPA